jgi:hypothetical protein
VAVGHAYTKTATFAVSVTATDPFGVVSPVAGQSIVIGYYAYVEADASGQGSITGLAVSGISGASGVVLAPTGTGYVVKVTRAGSVLGTFTATNGVIAVYGDGGTSDRVTLTGPSTAVNTFTLGDASATLTNTGIGTPGFTVAFTAISIITLQGGSKGNAFSLLGTGTGVPAVITGSGTSNTLSGPNLANVWKLTGTGAGTLDGASYKFSGIQNLVGGNVSDDFLFADKAAITGTLNGGTAGTLDLSQYTTAVTVKLQTASATGLKSFSHVVAVIGGSGTNTFIGANPTNQWTLTGANVGTFSNANGTVAFTNFGNLTGGTGNDDFIFSGAGAQISGSLNGGGGKVDELDYSGNGGGAIAVNLQTGTATSIGGTFTKITTLNGSSATTNQLTGVNNATVFNVWTISTANAGSVVYNSPSQTITFAKIQQLVGGSGVDLFKFTGTGSIGSINGGGAPSSQGDWLDYSALTGKVSVNLATGAASLVNGGAAGGVSNIMDVYGSKGGSTLTGNSTGNILVGGAGADIIQGGTGRSLLIGDKGIDHVTGGSTSGGDILIGGTTSYDTDSTANIRALMALLAEWQSGDSYSTRFTDINTGVVPGGYSLNFGTTVKEDSAANVVSGAASGLALDWFFAGSHDKLIGFVSGEHENNT